MNIDKYWNSDRDDYSDRPKILFQDEHIEYLKDCKRIIDLGCGTGQLVKKLKTNHKVVYGLTYNKLEVENALTPGLAYGDMHNIPFPCGFFDGFVMWDTLEHCQSAYIALCEARRILITGGKGLIFMPGQNWLNCHCHICCYTVPQMIQLLKQSGLRLENVYEKKYPDLPNVECDGMAVYEVINDIEYKPKFDK
jgi:ubiquinone/menaquinone biosynthesis C-methylase UbiE